MVHRPSDNSLIGSLKLDDSMILATSGRLIRQTLKKLGPTTVSPGALISLLEADPQNNKGVIKAVMMCPSLSARLLSVINSAAFGITRQIDTVERAVLLLGGARARTVAMAYGLRLLGETSGLDRDVVDTLWVNSLRKAFAAKRMCEIHRPQLAESAYCHGLIQDIGLPMLMAADYDYYRDHIVAMTHKVRWTNHERDRFGFDHTSVGHGLLREWSAPEHLQKAVLNHHHSPRDMESSDEAILRLSSFFASLMPHLDEEPAPHAMDWIQAIHARFLADYYPTPDAFFAEVAVEVNRMRGSQEHDQRYDQDRLTRRLTRAVTANAIAVTARLCYMEHRARRQREGIAALRCQAFTDGLTNVLNRRGFVQLGQRRLDAACERHAGVCCMLGDLDDFKQMNDNHGHEIGDMVLRGLAKLLRRRLGDGDLIGRIGGDEFAVLVTDLTSEDAEKLAERLVDSICRKAVRVKVDLEVKLPFSLGAVFFHNAERCCDIDQLLRLADQAMYRQKRSGKNGLCFVDGDKIDVEQVIAEPVDPETRTRRGTRSE